MLFWRNLRRQLLNPLVYGAVEVAQLLPLQSLIEGCADVGASQPEFNVIHLVGHRVLGALIQSTTHQQQIRMRLTLIIPRRKLTEPKTALAGAIVATSFVRFKASMAAFNTEIEPSRSLGCLDPAFMVETRGSCERAVRRRGYEGGCEPYRD